MENDEAVEGKCHHCSRVVYVRRNKGGKAYYRCGACQLLYQHGSVRASDEYLRILSPKPAMQDPPPKPESKPAQEPAKSEENPPEKPAAKKAGPFTMLG